MVTLILTITSLLFIDDVVNPNPLATQPVRAVKSGNVLLEFSKLRPEWVRTVENSRWLLHVNDTVSIQLFLEGCRLIEGRYVLRVRHVSTGRVYEYAEKVEVGVVQLPLFVVEFGGVHELLLLWDLKGEGVCEYRVEVVALRGDKSGYILVYTFVALAGLLLMGVAGYVVWGRREVV